MHEKLSGLFLLCFFFLFRFTLPIGKPEKQNERDHEHPIGLSKTKRHRLVDTDNEKAYGKWKNDNVEQFHGGEDSALIVNSYPLIVIR